MPGPAAGAAGAATNTAGSAAGGSTAGSAAASGISTAAGLDSVLDPGMTLIDMGLSQAWNVNKWRQSKRRYHEQTHMKYQYAIDDMRRAGINPALMFGGASVQANAGGQANISDSKLSESRSRSVASASAAKQARISEALALSQLKINNQMESKIAADHHVSMNNAAKIWKESEKIDLEKLKILADTQVSNAQAGKLSQETIRTLYQNYQSEKKAWLYKGKKGKFFTFGDWLKGLLSFKKNL